jgi:hypothetical protein
MFTSPQQRKKMYAHAVSNPVKQAKPRWRDVLPNSLHVLLKNINVKKDKTKK